MNQEQKDNYRLVKINVWFYSDYHKGYLIFDSDNILVWKIGDLTDYFFKIGKTVPEFLLNDTIIFKESDDITKLIEEAVLELL